MRVAEHGRAPRCSEYLDQRCLGIGGVVRAAVVWRCGGGVSEAAVCVYVSHDARGRLDEDTADTLDEDTADTDV